MINLKRGMIIDVDLNPTKGSETGKIRPCIIVTNNIYNQKVPIIQVVPLTEWNLKKAQVRTNIVVEPSSLNGLAKKSIADCLQTRPIDYRSRLLSIRGELEAEIIVKINKALQVVYDLEFKQEK